MQINDEEFYSIMYSMRSALCTAYGLVEKAVKEADEEIKNDTLTEIKHQIIEFVDSIEKINPSGSIQNFDHINNFTMKNTRALVIDDNEISNYIIQQMLEQFGIQVDIAMSGIEGVEMYNNNDYDVVFVDYIMPDMDGIETATAIRNTEKGKKQLMIGLTASTVPVFKSGLNELGIELILFKPVKKEQMAFILYHELKDKVVCDFTTDI